MEDLKVSDLISELHVLEIKPNQALCITLATHPCDENIVKLRDLLEEQLGCNVVIMPPGTELSVLDIKHEDNSN